MFDVVDDTEEGMDSFIVSEEGLSELAYIMGEDEDVMEEMVYDMGYSIG